MHHLLTSGKDVSPRTFAHPFYGKATNICRVQGSALLDPIPPGKTPLPYSHHLIDTILHCLAYDPSDRITAANLVRTTQEILSDFDAMPDPAPLSDDPLKARALPNIHPPNKLPYLQTVTKPPLRDPGQGPPPGGFKVAVKVPPGEDPVNPTLLFPPEVPERPGEVTAVIFEDYPFVEIPPSP